MNSIPNLKNQGLVYFILVFNLVLFQCHTSKDIKTDKSNNNRTSAAKEIKPNALESETQSIIDMLSKISGIQIDGSSVDASILIRGINTINGNTQPLFIVNGTAVGNGIRSVYYSVLPNQIQSIRVLKGSEASFYGVRGGGGVIEIRLKE